MHKIMPHYIDIQFVSTVFRNIKTMINSIIQVYPYIQSVYLYLDGYDRYFSSADGVVDFKNKEVAVVKNFKNNFWGVMLRD